MTIGRKRTSMRLEREMWDWLQEVAAAHGLSVHRFCTMVDAGRPPLTSLTAAIRVEIARFYRDKARRYAQALARHDQPLPQPSPVGGS
ncbi:MAG: ribbon-helix-helix domain-containing protein [Azospirillaceae bacterium]